MAVPLSVTNDHQRQLAIGVLQCLSLDGKEWQVTIERKKKRRTNNQNALLHDWFGVIASETGYSAAEIKEIYRDMFLGTKPMEFGDKVREVRRSTTSLTTQEFSEFMDHVHHHAVSELGIYLPVPEDLGR